MGIINKRYIKRIIVDFVGFGLIFISPFLSLLPGPGGLPVFITGLVILSANYEWARRLRLNFEKNYKDFVNKYLVANKKIARTVDALSILIIALGIFVIINTNNRIIQAMSFGAASFSTFVIISNQNRLSRAYQKIHSKLKRK